MKIDFKKLIEDYNKSISEWNNKARYYDRKIDLLTQSKLAREMVAAGIFISERCAINLMQLHQKDKAKGITFDILNFLCCKFKKRPGDIITSNFI